MSKNGHFLKTDEGKYKEKTSSGIKLGSEIPFFVLVISGSAIATGNRLVLIRCAEHHPREEAQWLRRWL